MYTNVDEGNGGMILNFTRHTLVPELLVTATTFILWKW